MEEDPLPGCWALSEQVLRLTAGSPLPWLELVEDSQVESLSAAPGKSAVLRRTSC